MLYYTRFSLPAVPLGHIQAQLILYRGGSIVEAAVAVEVCPGAVDYRLADGDIAAADNGRDAVQQFRKTRRLRGVVHGYGVYDTLHGLHIHGQARNSVLRPRLRL